MNNRIKELFLQAGFHPPVVKQMGDEYKFEKFVELIVKECTNMLPNDSVRNEKGVHMFYVIREHFGVPIIGR